MTKRTRRLPRRALWLGFLVASLPLAVLLVLQFRWLAELETTSAIAHRATLDNYLETVAREVEYRFQKSGERALNLSPWVLIEDDLEKAAHHFAKKPVYEARRLFLADFELAGERGTHLFYFDPASRALVPPEWTEEVRSIYVALASWATLAHKGGVLDAVNLVADERSADTRIVLLPITDGGSRVVGAAGMILDQEHFETKLLPAAAGKLLGKLFTEDQRRYLSVAVFDPAGRQVFSTGGATGRAAYERARSFPFAFTDWQLRLADHRSTAGEWARTSFRINFGLSLVLALVLLSGIALALRSASRVMRLSQMKSDFVSNVSHELRTPLASIRVFGELLRLGKVPNDEKVREYGEYIETESRRLTQLINNILDFAKIESGAKSYRLERADLAEVVAETLSSFEVRLKQSGFRVTFERPDAAVPVRIEPGALAQSVANLVDNAVKYSNGSREIVVEVAREDGDAVLSVQDWGVGIPRAEQEKIFDRFHRVSTGLVHDVKGSGLGLAIVQHIVQAHGGRVRVSSRPGQGSTFAIHLPLDREAEAHGREPARRLDRPEAAQGAT